MRKCGEEVCSIRWDLNDSATMKAGWFLSCTPIEHLVTFSLTDTVDLPGLRGFNTLMSKFRMNVCMYIPSLPKTA